VRKDTFGNASLLILGQYIRNGVEKDLGQGISIASAIGQGTCGLFGDERWLQG
jgi:hypothetical protein